MEKIMCKNIIQIQYNSLTSGAPPITASNHKKQKTMTLEWTTKSITMTDHKWLPYINGKNTSSNNFSQSNILPSINQFQPMITVLQSAAGLIPKTTLPKFESTKFR